MCSCLATCLSVLLLKILVVLFVANVNSLYSILVAFQNSSSLTFETSGSNTINNQFVSSDSSGKLKRFDFRF